MLAFPLVVGNFVLIYTLSRPRMTGTEYIINFKMLINVLSLTEFLQIMDDSFIICCFHKLFSLVQLSNFQLRLGSQSIRYKESLVYYLSVFHHLPSFLVPGRLRKTLQRRISFIIIKIIYVIQRKYYRESFRVDCRKQVKVDNEFVRLSDDMKMLVTMATVMTLIMMIIVIVGFFVEIPPPLKCPSFYFFLLLCHLIFIFSIFPYVS